MTVDLMIERLGQSPKHVLLVGNDDPGMNRRFAYACEVIAAEWAVRLSDRRMAGRTVRRGDINEWLKRTSFDFLRFYIDRGLTSLFEDRLSAWSRVARGKRRQASTSFQLGLFAIFACDPDLLGSSHRTRFGRQMWVAYRHYVPSALLEGFCWQRGEEQHKAPYQDVMELAFTAWVARCYRDDPFRDAKGSYPPNVMEEVARLERSGVHEPYVK